MHRLLGVLLVAGCGRVGFDARGHADDPDANPLPHVTLEPGWSAGVFHDFSAKHDYRAVDFVDGNEMYDNAPSSLFVLHAPFPQVLGMTAGRVFVELGATTYVAHDYGRHAPNTAGLPDELRGGTFVDSLDNLGPVVLLASSSDNGGDGTYRVKPDYSIATDLVANNTRGIVWDGAGAFDARGTPDGYLLTSFSLTRRSDVTTQAPGDVKTGRIVDSDLLVTRTVVIDVDERLVRIASATHAETELHTATAIELGEGSPPSPYFAYAIADRRRLMMFGPDGPRTVAEVPAGYTLEAATAPPSGHPLAGAVYVLEANRALDLDRVLVLTPP